MIFTNSRTISLLASDALNKHSNKISTSLEKKETGYKDFLSPLMQNETYDSLHLDSLNIKAKELFAIQTSFEYNNEEYHTVLQKQGNTFKPTKVYKRDDKGILKETNFTTFINGKNGIYYNTEDLNKFISALIFKGKEEVGQESFIDINNDFISFIKKNLHVNNNQQILKINVNNVGEWAKMVYTNVQTVKDFDYFKQYVKAKLQNMYKYLSDEKAENIANTYSNLLENGNFKSIDSESITKITLADIPTMQRFISGQLDEDESIEYDARNKMITSFLSKANFEIKECSATNYLLSGVSNSSVPVFYSSSIIEDNTISSNTDFSQKLENADKELKKHLSTDKSLDGLLGFIKKQDTENNLYSYTYLKIVKDILSKDDLDTSKLPSLYNIIEKVIKNMNSDARLLSNIYKKQNQNLSNQEKKSIYTEVINNAMLVAKASLNNTLKVAPTERGDKLFNSRYGQKLPIELFYSNNEQIANFQKNVGIRKDGDSVETFYGMSITGVTEVENVAGKLKPVKMYRFDYKETGFEQIGNIVSKLAKLSNDGKLVYEKLNDDMQIESKSYDFNIEKNLENLQKNVKDKFLDSDGNVYKSQLTVGNAIVEAVKKIDFAYKNNTELSERISAVKKVIQEDTTLQKLLEVGDSKKPDFEKIKTIRTAVLNASAYNRFIYKNKDDLLKDGLYIKNLRYPSYIKDEDDGMALARKTTASIMLDLQKNLKIYEFLSKKDHSLNTLKETIEKIIPLGERNPYRDKFLNQVQLEELQKYQTLTLDRFIKSLSSLIAAKFTQSIPNNLNYWYGQALVREFYPKTENIVTKGGREIPKQVTTVKDFKKLIYDKVNQVEEDLYKIRESVNEQYQSLKSSTPTAAKPKNYALPFDVSTGTSIKETIEAAVVNETDVSFLMPDAPQQASISDKETLVLEETEELTEIDMTKEIENNTTLTPFDDVGQIEIDVNISHIEEEQLEEVEIDDSKIKIEDELGIDLSFEGDLDSLGDIKIPNLDELQIEEFDFELDDFNAPGN